MPDEKLPEKQPANELEKTNQQLEYWRSRAHVLTPFSRTRVEQAVPYYIPSFRTTLIDPNPDNGEVYPVLDQPGKLALTKIGLQRLEQLAGIKWGVPRVVRDPNEPLIVRADASAEITDIDGTIRNFTDGITLDFRADSAQVKGKSEGRIARMRSNIVQLAETGAKNRVRRGILGILSTYTPEQLKKPFVVLKMVPDKERLLAENPTLLTAIAMQQFGITKEIFEQAVHFVKTESSNVVHTEQTPPGPVIEIKAKDVTETKPSDLEALRVERLDKLNKVIDAYSRKGLLRGKNKPALNDLNLEQLEKVLESLEKLPDRQAPK